MIFESVSNPDDPESVDILSYEFLQRSKVCQIQILLGEIKKHISSTEEAVIKIEYVKKLYAQQLKKLISAQRSLREKETQLEFKEKEVQIKDEQIKRQFEGNDENLTLFKE